MCALATCAPPLQKRKTQLDKQVCPGARAVLTVSSQQIGLLLLRLKEGGGGGGGGEGE